MMITKMKMLSEGKLFLPLSLSTWSWFNIIDMPQSHILGMMMDIYNMIPAGGVCYFADKNALKGTLLENIQHYR